MPSLGADMEQGVLIEWLVKVGDRVRRGDIVAVVETPKATIEVECFESGTVTQLLVEEGQTVPVGEALALLGAGTEAAPPAPPALASPLTPGAAATTTPPVAPRTMARPSVSPVLRHLAHELGVDPTLLHGSGRNGALTRQDVERAAVVRTPVPKGATLPRVAPSETRVRVSPLARRLAAEKGLDLALVDGSGSGGGIRAEDVRRAVDHKLPIPTPGSPPAARTVGVEGASPDSPVTPSPQPESGMRRSIAALMTLSWQEIPHYHLSLTIDLWHSLQWMKERNRELEMSERLVPAVLLLAATARAARTVPELNGHWIDGAFHGADDVDLGLVLSLRSGGLLVPSIGGADRLSVGEMMARIKVLTRRARSGRLHGSDLLPPSITVSNLGDQGVDSVLGVIYPPQVALVGFGAVAQRPWAVDGLLGVRPLVTMTLAGDHRATDGATGSRLLRTIDRLLQSPEEL